MAFNEQEQSIIKWGLANGKSKQDVTSAIEKYRSGGVMQKPSTSTTLPTNTSTFDAKKGISGLPGEFTKNLITPEVRSDVNNRVQRVGEILNRKDSSLPEKAVQTFGQGAGAAANFLEKSVLAIPGAKEVAGAVSDGIDWLATSNSSPLKHLGDVIGSDKSVQKMVELYDTDQNFKDSVDAVGNTVRLGGDVDALVQSTQFAKNVVERVLKGKPMPTPVPPKEGSIEAIQESQYGFKPGMRKVFDDALMNGDKSLVKKLLPDVPQSYKATLTDKINSVIGKQTDIAPGAVEAGANVISKEKAVGGNIVKDIIPNAERWANHEVTKALDLTQGDVKNIAQSTGNEVGEFIADKNLIGVNKESTLKNVKDFYDTNYKQVRSEIAKVKTRYLANEIPQYVESLKEIKKQITDVAGLQEANKEIDVLLKKKVIKVEDVQRAKELLDDHFSLYKATGDVKEGVAKTGLAKIRSTLQTFIEKEVKKATGADIRELNNNVRTARSISDAIETRSTRGLTRSMISASDLITFLTGSAAFGNPLSGALAVVVKKIYQSPSFKLRVSKWLDGVGDTRRLKIQQDLQKGIVPPEIKELQSSVDSGNKESAQSKELNTNKSSLPNND